MAQDMDATGVCCLSRFLSGEKKEGRGISKDTEVLSAPIVKELAFIM